MNKAFSTPLDDSDQPLIECFTHETGELMALREMSQKVTGRHFIMMSTPAQARCLTWFVSAMGVKQAIEVGVFTGYGTLAIAQALPENGRLIACDHDIKWPSIGKPYWERAGVANRIDLRIAPAVKTLQSLIDQGEAGQFDFIFVDADKVHYGEYNELAYQLLRREGILVFDNALWVGEERVVEQRVPATRAIANLWQSLSSDDRYQTMLIPLAQGMLFAKKC